MIFAVAFIVIWGGFTLLNYLVPSQDFSEAENRALAQFPVAAGLTQAAHRRIPLQPVLEGRDDLGGLVAHGAIIPDHSWLAKLAQTGCAGWAVCAIVPEMLH